MHRAQGGLRVWVFWLEALQSGGEKERRGRRKGVTGCTEKEKECKKKKHCTKINIPRVTSVEKRLQLK